MSDNHGMFQSPAGWVQEAGTPAEAVKLEYDGWQRLPDEKVEALEAAFGPHPPAKNASTEAWVDYATELGVPVPDPDEPKRGAVIDAVRDAGHPVGDDE